MTSKWQSSVQANILKLKHGGLVDTLTLSLISSWDLEKNHTLNLSLNISQIGIKELWVQRIVPKTAWADVSSKWHLKMQTWNVHNFIIHRLYYHQQHVSYQFTKVKQNKIILDHVFCVKGCKKSQFRKGNMGDAHLDMQEWSHCDLPCSWPCFDFFWSSAFKIIKKKYEKWAFSYWIKKGTMI